MTPAKGAALEDVALDVEADERDEKAGKAAMSATPLDCLCALPREQQTVLAYSVMVHLWAFSKWMHC